MHRQKVKESFQPASKPEIIYYTDPLCCWSWAFEPQWRRLRYEFKDHISWRYCMAGLIPDWKSFRDPMNSVSKPVHLGPVWMEAGYISGMPVMHRIWFEDAPASSYPACIGIKCAELQSPEAAEAYLRCLREAVMIRGINISRIEALLEIAAELEKRTPGGFSLQQFEEDWRAQKGHEAFRKDLETIRYRGITRFPTLTIQKEADKGILITGYRPYQVLLEALFQAAPELKELRGTIEPDKYENYWGTVTERELHEVMTTC